MPCRFATCYTMPCSSKSRCVIWQASIVRKEKMVHRKNIVLVWRKKIGCPLWLRWSLTLAERNGMRRLVCARCTASNPKKSFRLFRIIGFSWLTRWRWATMTFRSWTAVCVKCWRILNTSGIRHRWKNCWMRIQSSAVWKQTRLWLSMLWRMRELRLTRTRRL